LFVAKETEMQEKEMKLLELQEMYETRLLAMKVTFLKLEIKCLFV